MERAKKSRTPMRAAVTKLCIEIEKEVTKEDSADDDLLQAYVNRLDDLKQKIAAIDQEISGLLLDADATEAEIQTEQDSKEEYTLKMEVAKVKALRYINSDLLSSSSGSEIKKKTYKLPKTEIKKFDGEITEWLGWWAQFEKIHDDDELHDSDKFQYLVQAMVPGSRAEALVRVYHPSTANYPKLISALKERFGKETVLKRVYIRELIKMIINSSREKVKISWIFDKLEAQIKALESLGITPDYMNVTLFPMVESILPEETLMAWQRSANFGKDGKSENPPRTEFDYLMAFLKQEVENEGQRLLAQAGFDVGGKNAKGKKEKQTWKNKFAEEDVPTSATLYVNQGGAKAKSAECIFCSKTNHASHDCFKAAKMTMEEKKHKIVDGHCCYVCLKKSHQSKKCKSSVKCVVCNQRHYAIMCQEGQKNRTTESHQDGVEEIVQGVHTMSVTPAMTSCNSSTKKNKVILLKTLRVKVHGANGEQQQVRVVFDTGSQRSYVKTSLVKKLNCPVLEKLTLQNSLFGGYKTESKVRFSYKPFLMETSEELARKRIYLTDTDGGSEEIEILIGADQYEKLMTGSVDFCCNSHINDDVRRKISSTIMEFRNNRNKAYAEQISQEERDIEVKKAFQQQITRDEEGRYVVRLPWVTEELSLPSNRIVAEKRLVNATKKLDSQNEFKSYDTIFNEWEKEGIIGVVGKENDNDGHFLPHRPVFKPDSLTTPVRPVFDASCRVGKSPSLNHCLEKGPNLLELIPSILIRFRERRVGVLSDIRKAFQMVGVADEDQKFQKFLWWEDKNMKTMKTYLHKRVVFGLNCSPFILAAVLDHHLELKSKGEKMICDLLKKSLYVDNCVMSVNSSEEYFMFKNKSTAILADAKMDLRQCESNVEVVSESMRTKVLGLNWDKEEDTLYCQLPTELSVEVVTKRSVLSLISQIFDPIGFTCPAVLQPKLMLQDSWVEELGWDEKWDSPSSEKYQKWISEVKELGKIHIPRLAFGGGLGGSFQIHCFCDASKSVYAAVVFARVEIKGRVSVHLVVAKSRLAPLDKKKSRKVTIPRLELLGCLIGSRLTKTVMDSLTLEVNQIFLWSDSTTALAWIRRAEDWGTFVGNRSREINCLTKSNQWRHVPGHINPADLPSRGCSPAELLNSRWWEGPRWLYESCEAWPNCEDEEVDEPEVAEEKRKTEIVMTAAVVHQEPRFSNYMKNVRVAAWMRRFIDNTIKKKEHRLISSCLSFKEIKAGERDLIYAIQQSHYGAHPEVKNLHVELKEDRLWHVRTRLTYRDDTELFRSPILIPKEDPITKQLIEYVHHAHCHAGAQFVLGKLREKYWIVQGRRAVSSLIHKCVTCRRHSMKAMPCEPAPLPVSRIETSYAFQTTGVDLAGPIILKGGKKAWIVLYTCAVYRGVYLDVIESLSSDEFLDSLEKFACVMGCPNLIISDNGTNFVGANNLMKKLDWTRLEKNLNLKRIRWTFNPATAAWWGGWWERLVRTVKDLLRKMIGSAKLTMKELEKCLTSVSYTINNRPLTTLTEDCEDLIPLTPAMFMKDLPISGLPERDEITSKDLIHAYHKIVNLKKTLRDRFRKEYLGQLVQMKNNKNSPKPEVGDVVLVGYDNKKRFEWPLGKILELCPGKDGKVRVVKVKTATGILTRPLQRLYPLEIHSLKSVIVPANVIELAKAAHSSHDQLEESAETCNIKTRSGTVVKKPCKYGKWNY
ncbi:Pro-Pol polyprotein [Folsomia candida]|uniref:Pro-Pol polyprotein n=1 Tax=Folsomia candida TaxID=158441 RepID=A0A226DZQ8_FOLCA|nr:Pro-Pol polyprotein [Folsomia candida]